MMYLLDTNILSELIKKQPNPHLLARLNSASPQALSTSCICVMELRFGSALRNDFESFWPRVTDQILSRVKILPLDLAEALTAGDLLSSLQRTGQPIGIEDILIAATALHHQCTLITANTRHFIRIEKLALQNWLEPL
jgi:tRNA(fMet)-specific endonuclease VapC